KEWSMSRRQRRRSVFRHHRLHRGAEGPDLRLQPGNPTVRILVGEVVQIDLHRRALPIGFDVERKDDVLREFLVTPGQKPELAGGNGAIDILEQLTMFDAEGGEIAEELPHFGKDVIGIAWTEIGLEREADALHRLAA